MPDQGEFSTCFYLQTIDKQHKLQENQIFCIK